jgi:type II secretory pathway pseudopilin PulG
MYNARFFAALALLVRISLVAALDQPRCYLPNGSLDPSSYACNATAALTGGASACCLGNDLCYKSGTCFQGWSGVTYRQSCTDQSWKDPACPQYCLEPSTFAASASSKQRAHAWTEESNSMADFHACARLAFQSRYVWITQCDVPNGQACCLDGASCCNDTSKWFSWKPGPVTALLNASGTDWLPPEYLSLPGPLPRELVNASANIPGTTNTSADGSTNLPISTNVSCPSNSTSPAAAAKSSTPSATVAVGVVLGLLLSLALVGLVFFWRRAAAERASRLATDAALRQLQLAQQQAAVYGGGTVRYEKPATWIPVHEMGVPSPRPELYDTGRSELSTPGSGVTRQSRSHSSLTSTKVSYSK